MPAGPPDLLERIDRIMAELAELRAEVAGAVAADEKGVHSMDTPADDLADGNLLDTHTLRQTFVHCCPSSTISCGSAHAGRPVAHHRHRLPTVFAARCASTITDPNVLVFLRFMLDRLIEVN